MCDVCYCEFVWPPHTKQYTKRCLRYIVSRVIDVMLYFCDEWLDLLIDTGTVVYMIQKVPVKVNSAWNSFNVYVECFTVVGDEYDVSFVHELWSFKGVYDYL